MYRRSWLVVLGIFAVLTMTFVPPAAASDDSTEWVGKKAPDFALQDLEGNTVSLSDYLGKKVVWINFWGLRCGPCVRELPALEKIYEAHKDKGMVLLGIDADGVDTAFLEKQIAARDDLKAVGMTFPVLADPEFSAIDAYGLMGAPLNVMIDKAGVIRYHHEGYEDGDEVHYVEVLEGLLRD